MDASSPLPVWASGHRRSRRAEWSRRALATLIDAAVFIVGVVVVLLVARIVGAVSQQLGTLVRLAGVVAVTGLSLHNHIVEQGRSGQTLGKKQIGIALLSEETGKPLGPVVTLVRALAHLLDSVLLVGYLWPLWDPRKQTFADKVIGSVVVKT